MNEMDDDKVEKTTGIYPKAHNTSGDDGEAIERTWDFTSHKVIVKNVLKFMPTKKVNKMTNTWLEGMGHQVKFRKVKKPPHDAWICVTLEEESMVPIFIDYINNNEVTNKRGTKLFAQRAAAGDENGNFSENGRKRDNPEDGKSGSSKRQRRENAAPRIITEEETKDAMIPLWRKSYEEQLQEKGKEMVRKCAQKIVKEIREKFRQLGREAKRNKNRRPVKEYSWLHEKRPIEIEPILPAKSMVRNKCEFTFGYRYIEDKHVKDDTTQDITTKGEKLESTLAEEGALDTAPEGNVVNKETALDGAKLKKIPSVGAKARGWSGGVSHPGCARNIPSEAVAIVDIMEDFLADCPMPPYNSDSHRGFWRQMTVRSSRRTNECMLIFVHAPPTGGAGSKDNENVDNYAEVFESEKERLVSILTSRELPIRDVKLEEDNTAEEKKANGTMKVTSIFFQEFEGLSHPGPEHPVQHIYGERALKEKLGKCIFQISPGAFFQVNTETAETLYNVVVEKVREVASNPQKTLCFDVCCGTGTIGLTLMKEGVVGKVVGVDISAPAIDDAKVNANLNGYDSEDHVEGGGISTRFVADRAENVLGNELSRIRSSNNHEKIVAVVDPAREGLHPDVVKTLRGFPQVDRIVYVSCNPTGSLLKDSTLLCCPATKKYKGRPFKPTFAQPVDMFPYSDHCELVMVFDRMSRSETTTGQEDEE